MNPIPNPEDLYKSSIHPKFLEKVSANINKKSPGKTQQEVLCERQAAIAKECYETFMRRHQLRIRPMSFSEAVDEIRKMYFEHYKSWSKDELLEVITLMQAVLAAHSMKEDLI